MPLETFEIGFIRFDDTNLIMKIPVLTLVESHKIQYANWVHEWPLHALWELYDTKHIISYSRERIEFDR